MLGLQTTGTRLRPHGRSLQDRRSAPLRARLGVLLAPLSGGRTSSRVTSRHLSYSVALGAPQDLEIILF